MTMTASHWHSFKDDLNTVSLRATPTRIALLEALCSTGKPLTVRELFVMLRKKADQATLYRSLESMAQKGIVTRIDFQHGHMHYELVHEHHHHIVCKSCGTIEDVADC